MRKIKTLLFISIGIISFAINAQLRAEDIIVYGNEFKPPKYFLEDGKAKGILVDIMKYVDTHLPSSFKFELYPWARAYKNALKGKGGIIGLSMTNQRLEIFDYSDVMFYDTIILVVLKGNEFTYNNINDLKGKTVGVQRGSVYGEEFAQYKNILLIEEDDSGEHRLLKLLHKRIDVALIGPGKSGLMSVIKQNKELTRRKDELAIITTPFHQDPNYFAFAKKMNKKEFLVEFNKVLNQGHESGEIQKIIDKYSD